MDEMTRTMIENANIDAIIDLSQAQNPLLDDEVVTKFYGNKKTSSPSSPSSPTRVPLVTTFVTGDEDGMIGDEEKVQNHSSDDETDWGEVPQEYCADYDEPDDYEESETTEPPESESLKRANARAEKRNEKIRQRKANTAKGDEDKKPFVTGDLSEEKDSVIAEQLTDDLRPLLVFDDASSDWYLQQNGLWGAITKRRATKIISKALGRWFPLGFSMSKLNAIESFLAINLLLEQWERDRNLLPLANGVLNIKQRQLSPYSEKHKFNWQLPFAYDRDASIKIISAWLNQSTGGDQEAINIIRAFFKLALSGGDAQKFLEVIGRGGTGKSTLMRLLTSFVGERNQVTTDLKNLEGNRFEVASLYGKRLAVVNDSSRYGGEVSVLKAVTGGDPVRLERKNQQQSGSFIFDGVVVIASNEAIQTSDYTSGLIRRRLPVTFNRQVTDEDKAKWRDVGGIEEAMKSELPGLLNWALDMKDDELRRVVSGINGEMTQGQREHLVKTNKLAAWMDDNTITDPDAVTYCGGSQKKNIDSDEVSQAIREKLYPNYEEWCAYNQSHQVALQRFSENLMDICQQLKLAVVEMPKDKHGKRFKGIRIRLDIHFDKPTPVTRKKLGDEERVLGDEEVTKQTRASDDGDEGDDINSTVKKTHDRERF